MTPTWLAGTTLAVTPIGTTLADINRAVHNGL